MSGFRFSIITVNLNNRQGLERTLGSIRDQVEIKPEVIVIDGGSTDGSLDVIRDFEQLGVVTYHESGKDQGIYDAMNRGIAAAKGDFIQFLNSGDHFNGNDALKRLEKEMNNTSADIYFADAIVSESGEKIAYTERVDRKFLFFNSLCHQSVVYSSEVFNKVGGYDLSYKILADREHLYRSYMKGMTFRHVDFPMVVWEKTGYSSKNLSRFVDETRIFQTKYYSVVERFLMRLARKLELMFS